MCKNKKPKATVPVFLFIVATVFFIFSFTSAMAAPTQSEMVKAAAKEGSLVWLDSVVVPSSAKVLGDEFKKHYGLPNSFSIEHQRLRSGALSTRIAEEVKAGKVLVDIFGTAQPAFFVVLKRANALLKYDSPVNADYKNAREVGLTFDSGYWQTAVAFAFAPVTYPKNYPKGIKSWYDLLDPQLKGKKISFPTIGAGGGPLQAYVGWRQVLPKSFFEDLAKQDPTFDRGSSMDANQKLLQKEALVVITAAFRIMQTARQTGVDMLANWPKEGVLVLGHAYAILAKSKHPNAAKLFYDFLLSEKGMKIYIAQEGTITVRDGMKVPDNIKRYSPSLEDIKAIPIDWPSITRDVLNKHKQEFKEIFKR